MGPEAHRRELWDQGFGFKVPKERLKFKGLHFRVEGLGSKAQDPRGNPHPPPPLKRRGRAADGSCKVHCSLPARTKSSASGSRSAPGLGILRKLSDASGVTYKASWALYVAFGSVSSLDRRLKCL